VSDDTHKQNDQNDAGAELCAEAPRDHRPSAADRLAKSELEQRRLEAQLQTLERLYHLTLDELNHARLKAVTPEVQYSEMLIEALREACDYVAMGNKGMDATVVARWVHVIHAARGRLAKPRAVDGEPMEGGKAEPDRTLRPVK
jgi:hypothetical protein